MYTRDQLTIMKAADLRSILEEKNCTKSGNKLVLVERIMGVQIADIVRENEQTAHEQMLVEGAKQGSPEFERIMDAFDQWCRQELFHVAKYGKRPYSFETVDIREIRYTLRNIKTIEEFYDRFLNLHLDVDWMLFSNNDDDDRVFDSDTDYNDAWFMKGVSTIYNKQVPPVVVCDELRKLV